MTLFPPDQTLLAAALSYLERGWSVMPVHSTGARAKQPHPILMATGHTRITNLRETHSWTALQLTRPTAANVETWFNSPAGKGLAVITGALSSVVVLDLDGEAGAALMKQMQWQPHVRTGSGGYHLYLRHPGTPVRTVNAKSDRKMGQRWPGLDIRGDGGYAILPPSRNVAGAYEQLRSFDDLDNLVALPEELKQLLKPPVKDAASTEPPVDRKQTAKPKTPFLAQPASSDLLVERALADIHKGRNNAGFWLATQLRDNGYTLSEALPHMHAYADKVPATNTKGQHEPYTYRHAEQTLKSAYNGPKRYTWRKKNGS